MNWDELFQEATADALLAGHVEEVQEYAQLYLLAKERQKGCDGMAQFVALKEEFKDAIDKLFQYCRWKDNLAFHVNEHDLESLAVTFSKRIRTR